MLGRYNLLNRQVWLQEVQRRGEVSAWSSPGGGRARAARCTAPRSAAARMRAPLPHRLPGTYVLHPLYLCVPVSATPNNSRSLPRISRHEQKLRSVASCSTFNLAFSPRLQTLADRRWR